MNTGKFILSVLAGIATGAGIGLLLAPEKGERTRRIISRKGEDLLDVLQDLVDEKMEELKHVLNGNLKNLKKVSKKYQVEKTEY